MFIASWFSFYFASAEDEMIDGLIDIRVQNVMRRSYEHLHVCNIDYSILSDVYLSIYIYVNTIPCIL